MIACYCFVVQHDEPRNMIYCINLKDLLPSWPKALQKVFYLSCKCIPSYFQIIVLKKLHRPSKLRAQDSHAHDFSSKLEDPYKFLIWISWC